MTRPLMRAISLALISALPALADAASTQRFSASARLVPSAAASGGRFKLQAQLQEPGAALPSDAKQLEPVQPKSVAEAGQTERFKLLAAVRDMNAPAGTVCAIGILFQNGFE